MGGRGISIRRSSDVPVPDLFAHKICHRLSRRLLHTIDELRFITCIH